MDSGLVTVSAAVGGTTRAVSDGAASVETGLSSESGGVAGADASDLG